MTFRQLATRSLRILGVHDPDEDATNAQLKGALEACNAMLASWSVPRPLIFATVQSSLALAAGTQSVTIGSGGDINIARPADIQSAFVRLQNIDYPIVEESLDDYNEWYNKTIESWPLKFAIRDAYPLITMYLRPAPSNSYTLFIETHQPFAAFVNYTDSVDLPGEYEEAIVYNLALRLAPEYQRPLSAEAAKISKDSLKIVKNKNAAPVNRAKIPRLGSRYNNNRNINSGV